MLEVSEIRDKNNEIFPFGIITDKLVNVELRTLKTFVKFTTYTSEDYNSFTKTNNAIITPFEFWRKNLHSVVRCILRTLSRRRFYLIKKNVSQGCENCIMTVKLWMRKSDAQQYKNLLSRADAGSDC